jgi:hypothetical protein
MLMAAAAFLAAAMALGCAVAAGSHWSYPQASTREVTVPCEPAPRSIQSGDPAGPASTLHGEAPAGVAPAHLEDDSRYRAGLRESIAPREVLRTYSPLYRRPPPGIL